MAALKQRVLDKIEELGVEKASEFFGKSVGTISNWHNGKTEPSLEAAEMLYCQEVPGTFIPSTGVIQEPLMWEGRKVHVVTPAYKSICPDTHYTLFANYAKYGPSKIGMTIKKNNIVDRARNYAIQEALASNPSAEWFILHDDDMIIPCGNAGLINGRYGANLPEPSASLWGLDRLLSHPPEFKIVAGLYFGRHRFGQAQCASGFEGSWENRCKEYRSHKLTALQPERWVALGFCRIHRSVFEDLQKAIDGGKWPECRPAAPGRPYGFFNRPTSEDGEDVMFGVRCGEIGIQSYIDPVLECPHIGECAYGSNNTSNPPQEILNQIR